MYRYVRADAFFAKHVQDQFVAFQPHAGIDAVAGGKDVAGRLHPFPQGVARRFDALFFGAGLGFILGLLAFGIVSIFLINILKDIIIVFFQELLDSLNNLYWARMDEGQRGRGTWEGLCPA